MVLSSRYGEVLCCGFGGLFLVSACCVGEAICRRCCNPGAAKQNDSVALSEGGSCVVGYLGCRSW